jgi:MarC family integral membrane protein
LTEFVLGSFATFFVTVDPIQSAALSAVLTETDQLAYRRYTAMKSVTIAAVLLFVLAPFGDDLLSIIGNSLTGVLVGRGVKLTALSAEIILRGLKESGVFLRQEHGGPGAPSEYTRRSSGLRSGLVTCGALLPIHHLEGFLAVVAGAAGLTRRHGLHGERSAALLHLEQARVAVRARGSAGEVGGVRERDGTR